MGAMNSSQIEIKCLANGMGPYMGSQRVTGSPVREAVLGRPVLHGIQASCLSAPQVIGCRLVGS